MFWQQKVQYTNRKIIYKVFLTIADSKIMYPLQ